MPTCTKCFVNLVLALDFMNQTCICITWLYAVTTLLRTCMKGCNERSACWVARATLCNSSPSPDRNLFTESVALFWKLYTLEMASVRTEENPEPAEDAPAGD